MHSFSFGPSMRPKRRYLLQVAEGIMTVNGAGAAC
jgi:hypothetical protein